jgi:cytochrome c oxidase subunit 4
MADSHSTAGHHAPTAAAHAPAHGGGHATVRTYVNVAVILAVITAIEVATLYVPGIPNGLLVVSLLVMSAVKFVLVVGFFMHLRYDHNIMRSLFIGPLIIAICIIVALMALFSAFVLLPRH